MALRAWAGIPDAPATGLLVGVLVAMVVPIRARGRDQALGKP